MIAMTLLLVAAAPAEGQQASAAQRRAAKAHFDQGRAYYDAGAYDDAIREYQKAHARVPLPELLFNIAQAWRLKGDKPKAIEAYQRYLEKVPEGALAEEARNHVASLRLRIRVEEAEAAGRLAAAEAEAARKKAAEETAARQRLEAEAAARTRGQRDDDARTVRLVTEQAERERRDREVTAAARQLRQAEAANAGRGLRISGVVLLVTGLGVMALGITHPYYAEGNTIDQIKEYNSDRTRPWTVELDTMVNRLHEAQRNGLIIAIVGGVVAAGGVVLLNVGVVMRSRARAKLRAWAAPMPGGGALALEGRF